MFYGFMPCRTTGHLHLHHYTYSSATNICVIVSFWSELPSPLYSSSFRIHIHIQHPFTLAVITHLSLFLFLLVFSCNFFFIARHFECNRDPRAIGPFKREYCVRMCDFCELFNLYDIMIWKNNRKQTQIWNLLLLFTFFSRVLSIYSW